MQMPKRNKGETKSAYVSRCMGDEGMKSEFPEQDQRLAVCFSKAGESKLAGALELFSESYVRFPTTTSMNLSSISANPH